MKRAFLTGDRPLAPRVAVDLMDSTHLPPADIVAQIAELRRERAMRSTVYPHLVRAGKLTERRAIEQTHRLSAAIASLERLRDLIDEEWRRDAPDPADPPAPETKRPASSHG